MPDTIATALNIADLREAARRRLPRGLFDFIDRGVEDDAALRNNRVALGRIKLRPRVLADVSTRQQTTTLFGRPQAMPLVIAPTGPTGMLWYRGEIELARAAAKAGIPFTLASPAVVPMEDAITQGGGKPWLKPWFQLYMWRDRDMSYRILERAKAAGFDTLVLTVDAIVTPNREFHARNGFTIPLTLSARNVFDLASHPRWLFGVAGRYWRNGGLPRPQNYTPDRSSRPPVRPLGQSIDKNESLTFDDVRRLREVWPGTLIVKGILHPEDAVKAVEAGADGIVVSNHGALGCDAAMASIDALPAIADAIGSRATVLIDSGFRRGTDIVKALALGAKAVLIGRATLYGTAAGGEAGAARAIDILRQEIDRTLAQIGCRDVAELGRDHVILASGTGARVAGDIT